MTTKQIIAVILGVILLVGFGFVIARAIQSDAQEKDITFSILVKSPGEFTVDMTPKNEAGDAEVEVTKGTPAVFTITTVAIGGYDAKIHFSVSGLTEGTYSFSANDVAPGTPVTLTIQTSGMTSNTAYVCTLTASPV